MNRPRAPRRRRRRRPAGGTWAETVLQVGDLIVALRDAICVILGVVVVYRATMIAPEVDPLALAAGFSLLGLPLVLRSEERADPPDPEQGTPAASSSPSPSDPPALGPAREDGSA